MFNEILNQAEKACESRFEAFPDDYIGEDGLLHCGRCGTLKEVIPFGYDRKVHCMCKCQKERAEQERKEVQMRIKASQLEAKRYQCFDSEKYRQMTFAEDDGTQEKAGRIARAYVENFCEMKGKGLVFFGECGTGKSFFASCICNELLKRGYNCRYTSFARQIEEKEDLRQYDFVVIDDFAAERTTEYMNEFVWRTMEVLTGNNIPFIITTNLSDEELKNPADIRNKRIFSRLYENCLFVGFEGTDKRKKKAVENHKKYKELLGL